MKLQDILTEKNKGLWANIHAKRKRGEKSDPRSKSYKAAKKAGEKIRKQNEELTEAEMDKGFQREWEKSSKALRNHIKHELGKGKVYTANQKTELKKLDQIIKLAMEVPNKMAKIIDEPGKIRT